MSATITDPSSPTEPDTTDTTEPPSGTPELVELRDELRRQGRSIHDAQRAFSIFAVLAFLIATATLLAVAFKLDNKSSGNAAATSAATPAAATPAPAAATPAPAAATPAPALGHTVGVSLKEFTVSPTVKAVAAGKVTFSVKNAGNVAHELVVIRTNKAAGDLLKGSRADESGNKGESGDLAPGASKRVSFQLAAGHYALICNLPGHYKAGQHTDFTVR